MAALNGIIKFRLEVDVVCAPLGLNIAKFMHNLERAAGNKLDDKLPRRCKK